MRLDLAGNERGIIVQTTLRSVATFAGTGLHTGAPVLLRVCPAPAGHGIVFRRTDVPGAAGRIPALWSHAVQTPLNTRIENRHGVWIATIEHVMAALAGCGVHNALVEVDGPEMPIMDGSARAFVEGFLAAGLRRLAAPLEAIEIREPVEVRRDGAVARLSTATSLQIDFTIDFPDPAIGRQHRTLDMANDAFIRDLADSRTFCRLSDVEAMRAAGLALGGTLSNAVVVDGARVLTPGGLRHGDEAVRHKMLDALGDLATAGAPILGRYTGIRAGHALTNELLRALFARPTAWRRVPITAARAARLPGAGVGSADLEHVA